MDEGQTFDEYVETTISIIDGVLRGVGVMLVPVILFGLAVGISNRLFKGSMGVFN